jgi:hypothetical protein
MTAAEGRDVAGNVCTGNVSTARLLIFTPTWIDAATGEDAILPEVEAAIKAQQGIEFDWHVTTDNPYPIGDHQNVLHQYQRAREYFLHGKWNALLTIEHDNLLPDAGAVARMMDTPGDVIYAPYLLRHGNPVLSTWQYINDLNLGMSLTNYPRELRRARQENIHRICGVGMGCTLFRRAVLEQIEFGPTAKRNQSPDLDFAKKALHHKFMSYGRFDAPVLHYSETGRWLHPWKDGQSTMRYMALQTVNIMVDSNALPLVEGQIVELDPNTANDFVRAGYLEPIGVPDKVEIEAAVLEPAETADAPAQQKRLKRKAGA